MVSLRHLLPAPSLLLLLVPIATACHHPQTVRGDDVAGLDDPAMSTGLDKRDLDRMLQENMHALEGSAVAQRWLSEQGPSVAVVPLRNETSEHIEGSLDALISDIETRLVNAGHLRVISLEEQPKLVAEIKRQYSEGAFNPAQVAQWGKQVGARYIVTGKVYTSDERQAKSRRVQYFMFIQVLEVETGQILFQNKSNVTKAVI